MASWVSCISGRSFWQVYWGQVTGTDDWRHSQGSVWNYNYFYRNNSSVSSSNLPSLFTLPSTLVIPSPHHLFFMLHIHLPFFPPLTAPAPLPCAPAPSCMFVLLLRLQLILLLLLLLLNLIRANFIYSHKALKVLKYYNFSKKIIPAKC